MPLQLARETYNVGMNSGVLMSAPLNDTLLVSNPIVGPIAALLLTTNLQGRMFLVIANDSSGNRTIYISDRSYVATSGPDKGKEIPAGQERAFAFGQDIFLFAIADGPGAVTNVLEASG